MRREVLCSAAVRVGFITWLGLSAALRADVRLAPLFSDGVVLQRDQPLRVWGWAKPGEVIQVGFGRDSAKATAAPDGSWLAELPAQTLLVPEKPVGPPLKNDLTVRGNNTITVHDVLIGDVWICSGQSNMEFTVDHALDAAGEIARAAFPNIRQIKIGRMLAEKPREEFSATGWVNADAEHLGLFSAVGYFFARNYQEKTCVPVGLINCSWSGTSVEPWMSADSLAGDPAFAVVLSRWSADVAAYPQRRVKYEEDLAAWKREEAAERVKGQDALEVFSTAHPLPRPPASAPDHPYPSNPSAIYNGMVYPLRRAAVRGILWYQGEANAVRSGEYDALFQASIGSWRKTFGQPGLPFYWVQIANFEVKTDWARLREAQSTALALPATGQAVAIDIGDPANIHPANKQEVGRRLSLVALAKLAHRSEEFSGPIFSKVEFVEGAAQVSFEHAAGLHARSGAVMALELAGEDRVFQPAEGKIIGETLIVTSAKVRQPIAVRYAFSASPRANLYNLAGLPAGTVPE